MLKLRITPDDVLFHLKGLFKEKNVEKLEVASTDIAEVFGVTGPTIDYHLRKLVEKNKIIQVGNGKYKRKIFSLVKDSPHTRVISEPKKKIEETIEMPVTHEYIAKAKRNFNFDKDFDMAFDDGPKNLLAEAKTEDTLDDQINRFIEQSNNITSPNELLKHEDKEVLAVMNESLNQAKLYLEDLTKQLVLVQDKTLVQNLIEERNTLLDKIKSKDKEIADLQDKVKSIPRIDANRMRHMEQNLIATFESFFDNPNHVMAINRVKFKNEHVKHIQDVFNVILQHAK